MLDSKQYLISKLEEESNGGFIIDSISFRIKTTSAAFSPIQIQKSTNKVLIQVEKCNSSEENSQFIVLEYTNNADDQYITFLDLSNEAQPTNIFWSQLEDHILIIIYKDNIDLFDTRTNQIVNSFPIDGLLFCQPCGDNSILHKFAAISLIGNSLVLLTPIATDDFILSNHSYNQLKSSLNSSTIGYLSKSFIKQSSESSESDYRFSGLYGMNLTPNQFFLKTVDFDPKNILDFSMRNNNLFVICHDNSVIRIVIPSFPSLFDSEREIGLRKDNSFYCLPPSFKLERFLSSDSYLFGVFENRTYQIFNKSILEILQDVNLIGCIRKTNDDNENPEGIDQLLLLLSNDDSTISIQTVEDQTIYYECKLKQRLAALQKRRIEIANLQKRVEDRMNHFELTFKKHPNFANVIRIHLKSRELKKLIEKPLKLDFDYEKEKKRIEALRMQTKNDSTKSINIIDRNQYMIARIQKSIQLKLDTKDDKIVQMISELRELNQELWRQRQELQFPNRKSYIQTGRKKQNELYDKFQHFFNSTKMPKDRNLRSCVYFSSNSYVYMSIEDKHIFHTQNCPEMRFSKEPILLQDALNKDFSECPTCKPLEKYLDKEESELRSKLHAIRSCSSERLSVHYLP